jgi:putative photosynthetic complex assembly protein 2
VLFAARVKPPSHRIVLAIGATLAAGALAAIAVFSGTTTLAAAYVGFTSAILVWGFVELTFLTGIVIGTNREEYPTGLTGRRRVQHATMAILHHESALLCGGAAIALASHGGTNTLALATYATLWLMRLVAKLNLFLGVPNLHDELLPQPAVHLRSHFRRGPASLRLYLSILLPMMAAAWLVYAAATAPTEFASAYCALLAALLALAALEHAFMLMPLPLMNMWDWGSRASRKSPEPLALSSLAIRPKPDPSLPRRGL